MNALKPALVVVPAIFLSVVPSLARAGQESAKPKILAQKLVDETHAKHPETSEIGIVIIGAKGCTNIASTDKGDVGEKCEKDDSEPIRTDKVYVEREKTSFDVSLPLHDSSGQLVGSVGIELRPKANETQAEVVKDAQAIAKEMEGPIQSKASLTQQF